VRGLTASQTSPAACSYPPHVLSLRQRLASSRAESMKS
jgi:hypothetical protein